MSSSNVGGFTKKNTANAMVSDSLLGQPDMFTPN